MMRYTRMRWASMQMATLLFATAYLATQGTALPASPTMLGAFGDGMVLQHNDPKLHGCGVPPKSKVVATVDQRDRAQIVIRGNADASGCFVLSLPSMLAQVSTEQLREGATVRVIGCNRPTCAGGGSYPIGQATNVLFGHMVLCSGQSNMVHPLSYDYNASAQLHASGLLPNVRLLQVGRQWADNSGAGLTMPLGCTSANTTPPVTPGCSERNIWRSTELSASSFSAVCYLTAQELLRTEWGAGAAVGLVEADWGGSAQQPWQTLEHARAYGCPVEVSPLPAGCAAGSLPVGGGPLRANDWGCLFHGMIQPLSRSLVPEIVLWYQGEANANDPSDFYGCQLEAMVQEWRSPAAFNSSALPFFLVQLAPYYEPPCDGTHHQPHPCGIGTNYPHIRIAQAEATARLLAWGPSGYAVTHDIGDIAGGIHPHNKTEVGRRLAAAIRRQLFNRTDSDGALGHAVASHAENIDGHMTISFLPKPQFVRWGPTHNCSVCCTANTMVLEVCAMSNCSDPAAAWLSVPALPSGSELRAKSSAQGAKSVRYAWSNYPQCVLFDQHALPVGPFLLLINS